MLPTRMVRALVESLEEQEEFEVALRGPVLVGTDLTEAAKEAPRAGAELARAHGFNRLTLGSAASWSSPERAAPSLLVRLEIR